MSPQEQKVGQRYERQAQKGLASQGFRNGTRGSLPHNRTAGDDAAGVHGGGGGGGGGGGAGGGAAAAATAGAAGAAGLRRRPSSSTADTRASRTNPTPALLLEPSHASERVVPRTVPLATLSDNHNDSDIDSDDSHDADADADDADESDDTDDDDDPHEEDEGASVTGSRRSYHSVQVRWLLPNDVVRRTLWWHSAPVLQLITIDGWVSPTWKRVVQE